MTEIPTIWRTELWHPLVVHFPIALLVFATLVRFSAHLLQTHKEWIIRMSRVLLYSGTLFAWVAVYTGSMADAEVVRSLCDPTVVESHENLSYNVAWIFTIALLLDLIDLLPFAMISSLLPPWKEWLIVLLLVLGTGYLAYTAHLGATLVYQQGAAVYQPTEECTEFE